MTEAKPRLPRLPRPLRSFLGSFSGPGLAVALLMFAAALGPALTPRSTLYQGAAAGAAAISGYGLTVLVVWLARLVGVRPSWTPTAKRRGWIALGVVAVVVVPGSLVVSAAWQSRLREVMGMAPSEGSQPFTVVLVALVLALVFLGVGRGLRGLSRLLARQLGRVLPAGVARGGAAAIVVVLTVLFVNGTVVSGVKSLLNTSFGELDVQTHAGVEAPTRPESSGSPDSAAPWDTLGREGRSFVAGTRPTAELAGIVERTGADVEVAEPIRAYAGLTSADGFDAQAELVVAELDRTGAWDREALLVVATTGTGWVDPALSRTFEALWGGNTAIAAMQYSYLPSWISFVGDRATPAESARTLFETVRARWLELPEASRPKLYVAGISLGSFGSQGTFASLQDVAERVDGALWVGTPGFTPLWQELTAAREAGSPQIAPVLDGGTRARWGTPSAENAGLDLFALGEDWDAPRVVYLQHASDGVTWWSPDLIFTKPDWAGEPRGYDVLPEVRWVPVATFFALSIDLFVAGEAPNGHGHNFLTEYADGFAAVAPPPGWAPGATDTLREIVAGWDDSGQASS